MTFYFTLGTIWQGKFGEVRDILSGKFLGWGKWLQLQLDARQRRQARAQKSLGQSHSC
jgi:hypothetical protein